MAQPPTTHCLLAGKTVFPTTAGHGALGTRLLVWQALVERCR